MTDVLVNPGSTFEERPTNCPPDDVAQALAEEAGVKQFERKPEFDDDAGYFGYVFQAKHGPADVLIPGLPLAKLREGWVRIYVDGNSWMWKFAVDMLKDE